jgi:hypothetical protein
MNLIRRKVISMVVATCVGALTTVSPAIAQPAEPIDAPPVTGQYVPSNAVAVITLHPQAFFSQRSMRLAPLEVIRAAGEQQLGINPLQIQQVKVVLGEVGPMGPIFGAVVQLAEPVELAKLDGKLLMGDQPVALEGRDFHMVDGPPGIMLHQIDPRTMLVGIQPQLEQMLAAPNGEPPLSAILEQLEGSDHAMAVLAIEPIRPMLQVVLDQQLQMAARVIPPSLLALRAFPTLTDHVVLRVNVGDGFAAQLRLTATDEVAAEQLKILLVTAMADLRDVIVLDMAPAGFGEPEMADAMNRYIQRMSTEILMMLAPVRDGRHLTISLQEDVPQLALLSVMSRMPFPAVFQARGTARRVQSVNNLKRIGLAMHNYHDAYRGLPDPAIRDKDGKPLLSWRVALLPFVEEARLYQEFRLDEPWDSEHNLALVEKMPDVYRHPASTAPAGHTVYQAIVGEEIGLRPEGNTGFGEFRDGLSNSILVAEIEDEFAVPWTKPEDVAIDADDPWPRLGGHHTEGVTVLFGDGSVRLIPYWLEPEKLWHLLTRAGGERVENF